LLDVIRQGSPDADTSHSQTIREPAAEMLGTMMLTLVGNATNCQVVLSSNSGVASSQKGDYLSLSFGWACSL
jgi:aquaglyceroporin related protein, other eukaryote